MSKEKQKKEEVPRLQVLWPIFGAFIAFLILFVSTAAGMVIVQTGFGYSVTLYGSLVVLRQMWLQRAAYLQNREVIQILAAPVYDMLRDLYPDQIVQITRITNAHQPFDRMRARLMKRLSITKEEWIELRREYMASRAHRPSVMAVVPIFGIPWEQLEEQAYSFINQTYRPEKVILCLNDANDLETYGRLKSLSKELNQQLDKQVFEIIMVHTPGKRHAMKAGFDRCLELGADLVLNSDGDTYLDIDAIANAVLSFEAYPDVVIITGDVRVSNYSANWLTRLTALRYWVAFWKERAAQSWSRKFNDALQRIIRGQMVCASGPFMIMQAWYLAQVNEQWHGQTFQGQECTYGDDRHMTTIALILGWGTMFINGCIVWTDAPTELAQWIRQQFRWGQSANRENWWLVSRGALPNLTWLVKFDLFYLSFFPFLIAGAVLSVLVTAYQAFVSVLSTDLLEALYRSGTFLCIVTVFLIVFSEMLNFAKIGMRYPGSRAARKFAPIWDKYATPITFATAASFIAVLIVNGFDFSDPTFGHALSEFWNVVWPYIRIVLILQFVFQSLYGWILTGNWFFLLWPLYNFLYFRYLMKQKITTVIGMRITAWGTRSAAPVDAKEGEGG